MQKKSCAVLDFGSSKITAIVGERGVNKTFLIKARRDYRYEGFSEGRFFDEEEVKRTIIKCVEFLTTSVKGVDNLYVGVPGAFTEVFVKDSQISFDKKKKITEADIDTLFDSAFVLSGTNYSLINRSSVVYELDDYRRLVDPIGYSSEILKGKLSFVLLSKYFLDIVRSTIQSCGIKRIEFVSTSLAEAMYLVEAETRDRIAMILDVGYISTTFSLIQGDGILYQSSFDYGGGYVTASLSNKFSVDFDTAEKIKKRINLTKNNTGPYGFINLENGNFYNSDEAVESVLASLNELCEKLSKVIDESGYAIPEYVPLMITGGGIAYIRGAKEYLSGKLGLSVEILAPQVPLMDKPIYSSLLSLLDLTFNQNNL